MTSHTGYIDALSVSPDGRQALTGSYDHAVKLWDLASGRELRTFSGHTDRIKSVDFFDNGRSVLTSSADGTTRLWEAASGR